MTTFNGPASLLYFSTGDSLICIIALSMLFLITHDTIIRKKYHLVYNHIECGIQGKMKSFFVLQFHGKVGPGKAGPGPFQNC